MYITESEARRMGFQPRKLSRGDFGRTTRLENRLASLVAAVQHDARWGKLKQLQLRAKFILETERYLTAQAG